MTRLFSCIACIALLATSLTAAAGWDPAAVGRQLSNGEATQALKATRTRLADQPDDPQARFLQAMALADTGDTAGAVVVYQKLSAQYPQRARIWNNLGVLYARQGHLEEARTALSHAVEVQPGYATADENLGDVYVALASEAYRRAQTQGADADAMNRRRGALQRLVPSLPSVADSTPAASNSDKPSTSSGPVAASTRPSDARESTSEGTSQAIDQVLSRWAKAWSEQDVAAYLSVYSNDYQPAGDTTRAQWIRQQRVRVTQPKSVDVSVSDIQVSADSADHAQATFHEHYQAAGHERDSTRHMVFVREDGNWRIRRES